ncbi:helix-turn-helix domain-containing protein, partial [Methylobacterium trifolii]|uniref:helix-turn-helix domain-containing protein n=1 Tax=Methylobacterium trifolii TaxID=1003092 RepID=UPI002795E8DF
MTYAEEIRRQAEAAPRAALPAVTALLWRAYSDGNVSEAEAEALSALIDARQLSKNGPRRAQSANEATFTANSTTYQDRAGGPRKPVGSRPRTDASMERRRRWAASGRLPPAIAARFTLAEQGVLALVAAETTRRGDCRLAVGHLAAIVGVAETTVRNAIREACKHGLVTVEERRITGFRNDTNVVRIVSPEWVAWMRLARRVTGSPPGASAYPSLAKGGGCNSPKGTPTKVLTLADSGKTKPQKGLPTSGGRPRPMSVITQA